MGWGGGEARRMEKWGDEEMRELLRKGRGWRGDEGGWAGFGLD